MSDETPAPPDNVRPFRFPRPKQPPPPLIAKGEKYALYPLGEDVIVSKPMFSLVLVTLASENAEERDRLRRMLLDSYAAAFA